MSSTTPAHSSSGEPDLPLGAAASGLGDRAPSHDHSSAHDHADDQSDCDEAVAELYAFLDGELDDAVMIQVEAHLRRCSPCLEAFDFEADLRRVIAAKCTEQVTPEVKARFCGVLHQLSAGIVPGDADGVGPDAGVPAPTEGS